MVGAAFSDLLDECSWALDHSRRVCTDAERLAGETRHLLLTYRSHRLRKISGGSSPRVDGFVTLAHLLRSSPGDALCDTCLAFACAVSWTQMRAWTNALLRTESQQFQRASTCASCRRVVLSIIYKPQREGVPRVA